MNNIPDTTGNDIIQKITNILEKAILEDGKNTDKKVITEIKALLDPIPPTEVNTHGLVIHGLDDAARATAESSKQSWFEHWCNIYYDKATQKVSAEICLIGNKPSIVSQFSSSCPYVCTSIRPMTPQEIADKVYEAAIRNIEMALVEARYNIAEAAKEAFMTLTRWGTFVT